MPDSMLCSSDTRVGTVSNALTVCERALGHRALVAFLSMYMTLNKCLFTWRYIMEATR